MVITKNFDEFTARYHNIKLPTFTRWDDMHKYIIKETNCNAFSGRGICYRKDENTCILRSVDNTIYYDDNLSNIKQVEYTLCGKNGDQDIEYIDNKNLLKSDLEHIYIYIE